MKKIFIVCGIIAVSAIFFAKTGGILSNPFETKVALAYVSDPDLKDFLDRCKYWYDNGNIHGMTNDPGGSPSEGDGGTEESKITCGRQQGPCNRAEIVRYDPEPFYDCVFTSNKNDNCDRRQIVILNNLDDLSDKY